MEVWWSVSKRQKEPIEKVLAIRSTAKFLCTTNELGQEHRVAKSDMWSRHFPFWEEAHQYLVDNATRRVENLTASLAKAKEELAKISSLVKPEEEIC